VTAAGALPQHALHLGTLLGPVLLLAFWAGWSDLRAWLRRHDDLPTALIVAAALSIGAAAIHGLVTAPHVAQDPLYGAFFATCTLAQLAWAVLAVSRPTRLLLTVGSVGNAAVVALWAVTRTAGIPLGVAAGTREAVGTLDVACGLLELGIVACCAALLTRGAAVPSTA
jgi:hypothetical protein